METPPDAAIRFERAFVALVAERVEQAGMSHSEFGRRVFGSEHGSRLWRTAREPARARKIILAEAYRMAEVLGTDLPTLLWQISREAEARGMA